jgi:hypothetical protein
MDEISLQNDSFEKKCKVFAEKSLYIDRKGF